MIKLYTIIQKHLKKGAFLLSLVILIGCTYDKSNIVWVSSNQSAQWQVDKLEATKSNLLSENKVSCYPDSSLQVIDGFGACFNELGWQALGVLSNEEQGEILAALFDTINGCKFNICRMPIGANDYAVDWYSHNETAEDFNMDKFSIYRDKQRLIPYIREAKKINPQIQIWASPWCPPSWMKKNKHYACKADSLVNDLPQEQSSLEELVSRFIMEPEYLQAYANYFSKFIQAYQQEGIKISAVHVQNEPNSAQNFPSCVWKPKDLGIFIADYLAPQFQSQNLKTEIWLGTIERPHIERIDSVLQYRNTMGIVKGVGFQWAGKGAIPHVNKKYPNLKLMQTETECGNGSNNWRAAKYTFDLMKHYFRHGANSYLYWNMILDETGKSQWGWKQNSMITINRETKAVTYNPEFYVMKHFSAFIEPGFHYIKTSDKNCLAFKKAEKYVVIYNNAENKTVRKEFAIGELNFNAEVAPLSYNTFIVKN